MTWREGVIALDVTVEQHAEHARTFRFTSNEVPHWLACTHSRCEEGGLDVREALRLPELPPGGLYCQGFHSGDPNQPCATRFILVVTRIS